MLLSLVGVVHINLSPKIYCMPEDFQPAFQHIVSPTTNANEATLWRCARHAIWGYSGGEIFFPYLCISPQMTYGSSQIFTSCIAGVNSRKGRWKKGDRIRHALLLLRVGTMLRKRLWSGPSKSLSDPCSSLIHQRISASWPALVQSVVCCFQMKAWTDQAVLHFTLQGLFQQQDVVPMS